MRFRLNTSQILQSRTGPMHYEAGLVRGEVLQTVIGDIPISDFPSLRLDGYLMSPIDDEAKAAFRKAGLLEAEKGAPR